MFHVDEADQRSVTPPETIGDLFGAISTASSLVVAMRVMRRLSAILGAARYMLVDIAPRHATGQTAIVASDWPRDAIEIVGLQAIERLSEAERPIQATVRRLGSAALRAALGQEAADNLAEFGMRELLAVDVYAGASRGLAIFAADAEGALDADTLKTAQLVCSYLWSRLNAGRAPGLLPDPLSDRERECLHWVSEGKTTDEVALILAVSANTVNRYILHATQKLAAANRVMAIAIAIRNGFI